MKNLPDDELFNSVENRLRNYSELPDEDVWDRISGVTPWLPSHGWIIWTNRTAAALSLAILFFLFYTQNFDSGESTNGLAVNRIEENQSLKSSMSSVMPRSQLANDYESAKKAQLITGTDIKLTSDGTTTSTFAEKKVEDMATSYRTSDVDRQRDSASQISKPETRNESEDTVEKEKLRSDTVLAKVIEVRRDSATSIDRVLPPRMKNKRSKLTFYSMISPSLSFQHVTPDSKDGVVVEKINSPGVISTERFGYSFETGFQGKLGKRFQYIIGLSYYQQSQRLEYEENSEETLVESGEDLNFIITPETTTRSFDYSMRNVGVQAGILYTLKQRGLMHKAGLVLQYQKGLMHPSEDDVYDNSSSDYINYQLLYRVEYTFESGIGFFIQPSYTHSIMANESLNAPFKLKQSRANLGIGIVYRF